MSIMARHSTVLPFHNHTEDMQNSKSRKAYLYIHGFNDYFFQKEMGNCLLIQDTISMLWISDVTDAAGNLGNTLLTYANRMSISRISIQLLAQIRRDGNTDITLSGHSTGGLTVAYMAAMKGARIGVNRVVILTARSLNGIFTAHARNVGAPIIEFLSKFSKNSKVKQAHCDGYSYSLFEGI